MFTDKFTASGKLPSPDPLPRPPNVRHKSSPPLGHVVWAYLAHLKLRPCDATKHLRFERKIIIVYYNYSTCYKLQVNINRQGGCIGRVSARLVVVTLRWSTGYDGRPIPSPSSYTTVRSRISSFQTTDSLDSSSFGWYPAARAHKLGC